MLISNILSISSITNLLHFFNENLLISDQTILIISDESYIPNYLMAFKYKYLQVKWLLINKAFSNKIPSKSEDYYKISPCIITICNKSFDTLDHWFRELYSKDILSRRSKHILIQHQIYPSNADIKTMFEKLLSAQIMLTVVYLQEEIQIFEMSSYIRTGKNIESNITAIHDQSQINEGHKNLLYFFYFDPPLVYKKMNSHCENGLTGFEYKLVSLIAKQLNYRLQNYHFNFSKQLKPNCMECEFYLKLSEKAKFTTYESLTDCPQYEHFGYELAAWKMYVYWIF